MITPEHVLSPLLKLSLTFTFRASLAEVSLIDDGLHNERTIKTYTERARTLGTFPEDTHYTRKSTQNGLQNSILGRLSPETIIEITRKLPASSAAAFALSCRNIYHILGPQYVSTLQRSLFSKRGFLKLLQRDIKEEY
jgi:hypothetical protein